jgi:hypothetical protein
MESESAATVIAVLLGAMWLKKKESRERTARGARRKEDSSVNDAHADVPAPAATQVESQGHLPWVIAFSDFSALLKELSAKTKVANPDPKDFMGFFGKQSPYGEFMKSHHVQAYLKANGLFLPDTSSAFRRGVPDIAITYSWAAPLGNVEHLIHEGMQQAGLSYDASVWLDVICVNQNAKDIIAELSISDIVYKQAKFHFVLDTPVSLKRTWCLYEIALRMEVADAQEHKKPVCLDWPATGYGSSMTDENLAGNIGLVIYADYFRDMQASVPDDAITIKRKILERMSDEEFNRKIKEFSARGIQRCMSIPSPRPYALKALNLLDAMAKGSHVDRMEVSTHHNFNWKIPDYSGPTGPRRSMDKPTILRRNVTTTVSREEAESAAGRQPP